MPRDSAGNVSINRQVAVTGQTVLAEQVNVPFSDTQSILNLAFWRDGLSPMTGNTNMNGFKVTNLGDATADDEAINLAQFNAVKNRISVKSAGYNLNSSDYGSTVRFTASVPVTVQDLSSVTDGWFVEVWAAGGSLTITPTSPQTINGAASLTLSSGQFAQIFKASNTALVANVSGGVWTSKAIGEIYMVETGLTGVDIPPSTASDVTYIQLTSGLTGSGQFNEGKLTGESVTGTAPLVVATAVVSVAGSPLNGRTIRLLNTESRILRPSTSSGALQNDAMQNISGTLRLNKTSSSIANGPFDATDTAGAAETGQSGNGTNITFDASRVVRTANETRMKNLGVTAYMRVK